MPIFLGRRCRLGEAISRTHGRWKWVKPKRLTEACHWSLGGGWEWEWGGFGSEEEEEGEGGSTCGLMSSDLTNSAGTSAGKT
ncbi:hypothetical protein JZ751_011699 [Albula glossodonta]|uniref:Uncharacterized protein n=1 Tax=Albula glossodonta TaxID=121402 RepID=A0A8T2PQD5_9TELE|nr:hypothetical protein JZ751_011699 [Albula glossodonta]